MIASFAATLIGVALTYGAAQLHRLTGVRADEKNVALLHSAIATGVRKAILEAAAQGTKLTPDAAVKIARAHAAQSIPGVMAALTPTAEVFANIAKAKLAEELTRVTGVTPGDMVDMLRDPLGRFNAEVTRRFPGEAR